MELTPPPHFRNAGELPARYDTLDPRAATFSESRVEIDLRDCVFVRPPAALWCLVYLALASERGARCRLLVPQNMGVCVYLKSLGLLDMLKACGAEVDDRGIPAREDQKTILPIARFRTTTEASAVTNQAFAHL